MRKRRTEQMVLQNGIKFGACLTNARSRLPNFAQSSTIILLTLSVKCIIYKNIENSVGLSHKKEQ